MAEERAQRRLAAILSADVVGYSRKMRANETGTLAQLKSFREELLDPKIREYGGRMFKTMGDGFLIEFASAVDAVQLSIDVQQSVARRNAGLSQEGSIELRIGINVGDVIAEGEDLYGDGVNIASRLQTLADPGSVLISGTAFDQVAHRSEIRCDDLGARQVKNIDEPVRTYRVQVDEDDTADTLREIADPRLSAHAERPTIAVLPFANMSGDAEQEYFADGVAEDIITALSRIRQFSVVARNTTFAFKNKHVDIHAIAKQFNARYVLEGSVRKAGNRVRVTAQLIDSESGNHLWADRYDRDLEDIFEVQNELSMTLAAAISPALGTAELRRAQTKKPENIDAWDLYQRGIWHLNQRNRDDSMEALKLFERAMKMDSTFGPAYSGFAWAYQINTVFGYQDLDFETAMSAAARGVSLDEDDPFAHFALAQVHFAARDHAAACEEFEQALKLNPSFCDAHHRLAYTLTHLGRPEEAFPHLDSCLRMRPNDVVVGICYAAYCLAFLYLRDFEQAITWGYKSIRRPTMPWRGYAHLISALGHAGDKAGAQEVLAKLSRLHPEVTISFVRAHNFTTDPELAELLLGGLLKAGLPE